MELSILQKNSSSLQIHMDLSMWRRHHYIHVRMDLQKEWCRQSSICSRRQEKVDKIHIWLCCVFAPLQLTTSFHHQVKSSMAGSTAATCQSLANHQLATLVTSSNARIFIKRFMTDGRRICHQCSLQAQQQVRVQDPHNHRWVPGEVTEVLKQPRSYKVKTTAGTYR